MSFNPFEEAPAAPGSSGGCPEGFEAFGAVCYHFGDHSSYVSASASCMKYNAMLASVNDRNIDYLVTMVAEKSGNDVWVGDSNVRGRPVKRTAKSCPMMKGSGPDQKVMAADCTSANPFICEFQPGRPPMMPGGGGFGGGYAPAPAPYAPPAAPYPGPAGYGPPAAAAPYNPYPPATSGGYGPPAAAPYPPPAGSQPETFPNYGLPDAVAAAPTDSPDPPVPDVEPEPEPVNKTSKALVPIMIILLICLAFFAYKYWKKNFSGKPSKSIIQAKRPSNEDGARLQPNNPNEIPWNPPQSFENPVFQQEQEQHASRAASHEQHHEMEQFRPPSYESSQVPAGMTMDDPRDHHKNISRSKSGRSRGGRYNEKDYSVGADSGQPTPANRRRDESEFELAEGLPANEWGRGDVFNQMLSPETGGPPNSMTWQRDYRQQFHDQEKGYDPNKVYELQAFDSRDSYDPHLPDVVQHQPPEFTDPTARQTYGRRESNVMPSRPPPPERIRSVREDMMKARTMLPDAPKGNGVEENRADAPQYRAAPPRPGEAVIRNVPSMHQPGQGEQKDKLWAAAFHSLVTGEELPNETAENFKSMQNPAENPLRANESRESGGTNEDIPRAYGQNNENIEIMKMDSFEIGRNVEQVSAHNLRDVPDSGPKSIPVPVTQIPLGREARMQNLTLRDLDQALKEYKVENEDGVEFTQIDLKVPEIGRPADYNEGEIFDDLDSDDDELDVGARVAKPETTDQFRKSQIMNLKSQ